MQEVLNGPALDPKILAKIVILYILMVLLQ
jgi:hypothetical protein